MREWDLFESRERNTIPVSAELLPRREVLRIEVTVTDRRSVHRHFLFHWKLRIWGERVSERASEWASEWVSERVSLNPHSAREANGWGLVKTLGLRLRCALRIQVGSTSPSHFSIGFKSGQLHPLTFPFTFTRQCFKRLNQFIKLIIINLIITCKGFRIESTCYSLHSAYKA